MTRVNEDEDKKTDEESLLKKLVFVLPLLGSANQKGEWKDLQFPSQTVYDKQEIKTFSQMF